VSENAADFRDTLAELVETTYPKPADHPSEERWIAYQRGALPAEEMERFEEHLVRCRDCFDLVQAAEALVGPPEEETGEAGGESEELASAALWRLLRPQLLGKSAGKSAGKGQALAGRAPRNPWRFRLPETLAASFLVGLLGLTAWNLELRRDLQSARAPRPNAPIYDFTPGERFSAEEEKTLTAGPQMLVFHPDDGLPAYRLTIRDAATGKALSSNVLRLNHHNSLTLDLPELQPGDYRLELSGASGESAGKILERHLLHVVAAGPGG